MGEKIYDVEVARLISEGRLAEQYKVISRRLDSVSKENRNLKRQIEDLEAIIADGKKPDISVSENGVSIGCECGGYHLAKERISELERDLKECKDETNSWRHELERVNEECDIIAKDNGDLRQENHKLEKEASELRKEIIEKNKRMIELIEELQAVKAENSEYHGNAFGAAERLEELEDRHKSDYIRINQLITTIDTLTELYQKLREASGL